MFVLLNEQNVIVITIYYADIGLRVPELATDEKARMSPSTGNPIAFSVTKSLENPAAKSLTADSPERGDIAISHIGKPQCIIVTFYRTDIVYPF